MDFKKLINNSNRPSTNIKVCVEYVMSRPGCLSRLAGVNSPLLYTGT